MRTCDARLDSRATWRFPLPLSYGYRMLGLVRAKPRPVKIAVLQIGPHLGVAANEAIMCIIVVEPCLRKSLQVERRNLPWNRLALREERGSGG